VLVPLRREMRPLPEPCSTTISVLRETLARAPGDYARWLDVERDSAAELLQPYSADAMGAYPISTRVNSPKNDDAAIVEPLAKTS